MPSEPEERSPVLPLSHPLTGPVLVTGGGRGIGRAVVHAVAAHGAGVVAVSRTAGELAETARAAPDRIVPLVWDLADPDAMPDLVAAAEAAVGPLGGVVHAAAAQHRASALTTPVTEWRRVVEVGLAVPYFLSVAVARRQHESGTAGSHVFVASLTTSIGVAGISAYAAAKSGLAGVVRTFAVEWAATGVRVNAVAPGYIRTRLTADLLDHPERGPWVLSRIPMGRLGEPAEIAAPVVFLLSPAARYITGQILSVDGGWLAG
jgi:NAD(P)-dependent dehydrogenase (short-subunit alcohol dehydrogenase family)